MKTSLSMILRKFLFLVEFEPTVVIFIKRILTKKNSVYDCISSSQKQCFLFYIFGFNDNTIRNQKIFGPISGNTQKNGFW